MATKKTMSRHKARMKALHDVTSGLLGSDSKPKPVKSGTSPSEDSAGIKKFRESLQKQYQISRTKTAPRKKPESAE